MTARVPVVAELRDYHVAVASLPGSTMRVDGAAGAIAVVDGATSWWDAAALAVEAGAAAVLVAEPREVPLGLVGEFAAFAARSGVPIVVHRARLRDDLVALAIAQRAGAAPRVVVAECRAAQRDLPAAVRDAVGWTRALAGERLVVASASVGPSAGTALLRARDDGHVIGSLILAVTSPEGAVLRVQALGEATTELEIDMPLGRTELATSTIDGRLVAPSRFEAGERAALRRAVASVSQGLPSPDLGHLLDDAEGAAAVLDPQQRPANL